MSMVDVLQVLAIILLPLGVGLLLVPISLWVAIGSALVITAPELWLVGRELDIGSRE